MNSQTILNKLSDESSFDSVFTFERFLKEFGHDMNSEIAQELYQIMVKQRTIAVTNVKSSASTCLHSLERSGSEENSAIEFSVTKLIEDLVVAVDLGKAHLDLLKQDTKHNLRDMNQKLNDASAYITDIETSNTDFTASVHSSKCIHLLEKKLGTHLSSPL